MLKDLGGTDEGKGGRGGEDGRGGYVGWKGGEREGDGGAKRNEQ